MSEEQSVTAEAELPAITGYEHRIVLRPDAVPTAYRLRRLPLAVREEVSQELQRLLRAGVIERIDASQWVSPLVVSRKPDGKIRLCVDLRGPNSQIVPEVHPLPTIEELQSRLQGVIYSKLDLRSAYHQLNLQESSRDITAFITHDGLMRFRRVPFGLVSAGSACQKLLDDLLDGIPGCGHYMDDILVSGKTRRQHDERLRKVLDRLRAANVTINMEKSVFSSAEVDFCGHRMTASGITPSDSTVQAVRDAPRPTGVQELRSFMGLAGWFAKFIPAYADVVRPLACMLRKNVKFTWSEEAEESFQTVKRLITSRPILQPFQSALPIIVTSDASDRGAGAVLAQLHPDGTEHPVSYWSRSFTDTEQRYSVSEREALSAVQAIERWKLYLWGRFFTLRTDHSALTTLLSPKCSGRAGARIARWQARLQPFAYEVVYTAGSTGSVPVADALSRLPLSCPGPSEDDSGEDVVALVYAEAAAGEAVLTEEKVRMESKTDPVLQQLRDVIARGWPDSAKRCTPEVKPYFAVRHELQVRTDDVILRGPDRVIVPSALRAEYLSAAHRAHDGVVRTKQLLRSLSWWPGMDKDVAALVGACDRCQASDKVLSQAVRKTPLQPVPYPDKPWSQLGLDVVGPLPGAPAHARFAVTLTDYGSKWVEVGLTSTVTTSDIIRILSSVWSREGYPDVIVTDNGTQFTSNQFRTYLKERNIEHRRSSVYWPRGNGAVERFNRTLKTWFVAAVNQSEVSLQQYLQLQLARYRATPHCTTGRAPSELLHGRVMRLDLPVIGQPASPDREVHRRVERQQRRNRRNYNSRQAVRPTRIQVGDVVRVKIPGHIRKDDRKFSEPLKVTRQVAAGTFELENGTRWNSAHLARVPDTGQRAPDGESPTGAPGAPPAVRSEAGQVGSDAPSPLSAPLAARPGAGSEPPPVSPPRCSPPRADRAALPGAGPGPATPEPTDVTSTPTTGRTRRSAARSPTGRRSSPSVEGRPDCSGASDVASGSPRRSARRTDRELQPSARGRRRYAPDRYSPG
ncbi:uncharacterized protein K02A2.6-like [Amphibalanus amphitrite]|uniref:uncharacterized protein K02A2.6-like n=1 Tax=Amphibalanus amphitrite TaxID=1232801 RepID=UPI001C90A7A0|nr:uncharacterized protein K02A2.6-like [Amphibalanus amphitrite]